MKFDQLGNKYYLDIYGNVYGPNSVSKVRLSGISEFAVTTAGKIYAIGTSFSSNSRSSNWDRANDTYYKTFPSTTYKDLTMLNNDVPLYVSGLTGKTIGYNN